MCPITRKLGLVKILPISCPVTRVYLLGHARLNNKPCVPSPLGGDTWVNTYTDKDFHFSVASEDRGAFEKIILRSALQGVRSLLVTDARKRRLRGLSEFLYSARVHALGFFTINQSLRHLTCICGESGNL